MNTQGRDREDVYTPPLGFSVLTPVYDASIATFTRERVWRGRMVEDVAPKPGELILDIGSGTGRLSEAIHFAQPSAEYLGVEPDESAVTIARRRAARVGSSARFDLKFFSGTEKIGERQPNKIVSSLVLHQTPLSEKCRIIQTAYDALPHRGLFLAVDYGAQRSRLMKFLFRWTVQALDGVVNTQPNTDGILLRLIEYAGFTSSEESAVIPTVTGSISIFRALKL
jgi:ubiquinone/menaquinone biosynthesis C-methylase UbiE